MRRRNRIVKIINVSITITAILLVLLIIFLVKLTPLPFTSGCSHPKAH